MMAPFPVLVLPFHGFRFARLMPIKLATLDEKMLPIAHFSST
jgi:hypothetical protein